jgi:hypothetical protein
MESHQFEVSIGRKDREAKLFIRCPFIRTEPLTAHLKAKTEENDVSFIGDMNVFGGRFRGEGTFRFENLRDMEAKLEIITPFKAFDRLTIGGALTDQVAEIEFQTPFKELPNFFLKSSGIQFFEANDFTNFHPKLMIGLPFISYTVGG